VLFTDGLFAASYLAVVIIVIISQLSKRYFLSILNVKITELCEHSRFKRLPLIGIEIYSINYSIRFFLRCIVSFPLLFITFKVSGRSRGFAFVEMGDEAAEKAMREMDGAHSDGRTISVSKAREKTDSG